MTESPTTDDQQDEDVENDAVIGHALRASLIAFVMLCVPVVGVLVYLNYNKETKQNTEVKKVTLPTGRDTEAKIPDLPMVDVTEQAGIQFVHETGRYGDKLLPETMGSGVVVFDYNNDGHQDIFLINSSRWPWDEKAGQPSPGKLFAGNGDFTFRDVTDEAGLNVTLYGMGAAVGDYDNDGDTDLFLTAVGKNRLFRNQGGKFVDASDEAGVAGDQASWGTSTAFLDYDNDGLLDLFVGNYVQWSKAADLSQLFSLDGESRSYGPPVAFSGSFSYLYHNEGGGKFKDVSAAAGIQIRNPDTEVPLGKAMGVAPVDVNDDGWIDIVVANDTVRNFLFQNNKDGTFTEIGELVGIAYDRSSGNARGAMGIDAVVYREDGTIAIGIGNFANEASALYMGRPDRKQFVDAAMYTGLGPPTRQGLTFGLFFFDVDLDGRLDVLGANGHLEEDISKTQRTQKYEQAPQLFWNAGRNANSEFVQVTERCVGKSFCQPIVGRGAAYGDFDSDGDQDVVIAVSNGSPKVFRNDQSLGNHWLRIRLQGTKCNRDAIGAKVILKVGDRKLIRRLMPTRSYLSQSESVITLGLGSENSPLEVTVQWPGGTSESFPVDGANRTITLVQSDG